MSPGYWKRPDLTAAVFRDDPAGEGARLYRTGDLGRMSAEGLLEHLGRRDFQVKIRGQRIETGEVESALLNDEAVQSAVVAARDVAHGVKRLVAHIVVRAGHNPTDGDLQRFQAHDGRRQRVIRHNAL